MRIAVIDCGTNTFNLLIADATPVDWKIIFQSKLPVKLGAGGFEEQTILPSRFIRGMDALVCHAANTQNFSCEKIFAFATSAIRESSNGRDFIRQAQKITGINIELITGDREAELIFDGVRQTLPEGYSEPSLIMDIGGGSTEFILTDGSKILWKKSFLLGVSRIFDLVKPEDRLTKIDEDYMHNLLNQELGPLREALKAFKVKRLIGSSGSFDTMLEMYHFQSGKEGVEETLFREIPINAFKKMHQWLMKSSLEERLNHKAIPGIRAEYMPLSTFLVSFVLNLGEISELYHSAYSLKEGAMKDLLARIEWPQSKPEINESPEDYLEA
ncbi:MAG: hypothetical protein K1X54_13435 [Flavobacteriales bacterium]|nr:hypothetical protein [Flavobacteriales bacterium]